MSFSTPIYYSTQINFCFFFHNFLKNLKITSDRYSWQGKDKIKRNIFQSGLGSRPESSIHIFYYDISGLGAGIRNHHSGI